MSSIKSAYWDARQDAAALWWWLLTNTPGRLGALLRAWFVPGFFGACGKGHTFQLNMRVTSPKRLRIGSHCNFGQGVFITAGGGVTMGDYVGMGPDSKVWSVNHKFNDPDVPWLKQGYEYKEVVIGDDVWIGAGAFVMPGVNIGAGAIISAGTVLSKSVPAFSIVAGNPGRVVGWRKKPEADPVEGETASGAKDGSLAA